MVEFKNEDMTTRQILLAVLLCGLTAAATDFSLYFLLAESMQPGSYHPLAIPATAVSAIGLLIAFAYSIRQYAGKLSLPTAACFTFLGCIPIYLVMEVTIM